MSKSVEVRRDPRTQMLLLPSGVSMSFASWPQDWAAHRRLLLDCLALDAAVEWMPDDDEDGTASPFLPVVMHLLPRPDNTFNHLAISLANPHREGPVDSSHLGYLYETQLHFNGEAIRLLGTHTGERVGCHGSIELVDFEAVGDARFMAGPKAASWSSHQLMRDHETRRAVERELATMPQRVEDLGPDNLITAAEAARLGYAVAGLSFSLTRRPTVADVVDRYCRSRQATHVPARVTTRVQDPTRSRSARPHVPEPATLDRHQQLREAVAVQDCESWSDWSCAPHKWRGIHAETRQVFGNLETRILNDRGAELGRLDSGLLTLRDERVRRDAVKALEAHGIQDVIGEDAVAGFANATLVPTRSGWTIRAVRPEAYIRDLPPIGFIDGSAKECSLIASAYEGPVSALLKRHGLSQLTIRTAEADDLFELLGDPGSLEGAAPKQEQIRGRPDLLSLHRETLPSRALKLLNVKWLKTPTRDLRSEAALRADSYAASQARDWYRLGRSDELVTSRCRLCGQLALHPRGRPAYCFGCIRRAARGVVMDTGTDGEWMDTVVWALQELSSREFSGPPSLVQLEREPVGSNDPDPLVLLRMLVPRRSVTAFLHDRAPLNWLQWLDYAGLLGDGFQTPRGTMTKATDGHLCRSLMERHIDDFLHRHLISHTVEPAYPYHPTLNRTGLRADWRLEDGTYLEAFGLEDDPSYARKVQRKRQLCDEVGIRLIEIRAQDLGRLPLILSHWVASVG